MTIQRVGKRSTDCVAYATAETTASKHQASLNEESSAMTQYGVPSLCVKRQPSGPATATRSWSG